MFNSNSASLLYFDYFIQFLYYLNPTKKKYMCLSFIVDKDTLAKITTW